jgi:type IV pilus assembly protein PilP
VIPRAIGIGLVVFGLGRAAAQTAADAAAAIAIASEQEKGVAGQAQGVTQAAVKSIFGRGGSGVTSAPAAATGVPPQNQDANVAPMHVPADGAPAQAAPENAGDAPPAALLARARDPFRPFTLDLHGEVQDTEILTPLQRYEIPQLRLVGVVLDLRPPRAMLQDNSGMGFIVTPGTPIGRRHGVVTAIEARRVVVEERVLDYYGREQVQQVVIEMPKDDKPQVASQERP